MLFCQVFSCAQETRWVFHLSQSFTEEQKPFWIRLGSWCVLSLTDFHRGTEAIQRTSWVVACFASHRFSQRDRSLSANRENALTMINGDRYHRTLQPSLAVTFCDICMLEAFCEIETVRKKGLLNLWVLWEKKNPHELNSTLKCSVKSVSSVRDKAPQRVSKMFFFSQSTQKNRTHKGAQRH